MAWMTHCNFIPYTFVIFSCFRKSIILEFRGVKRVEENAAKNMFDEEDKLFRSADSKVYVCKHVA